MEKTKRVVSSYDKEFEIKKMTTFLWNFDSEITKNNGKIELNFSRDESIPQIQKVKEIEKNFDSKIIPLFVSLSPSIVAFITVTIFFILFLINPKGFDRNLAMLLFFIPAGACLIVSVLLMNARMSQMKEMIDNREINLAKAKQQIEKLEK